MPITSSAKKALRASAKKRVNNIRRKTAIDTNLKKFRKLVVEKKAKEAQAVLANLSQALDKAAKTNYIKANTASRLKSRAAASLKKISA
ncbi:MAG: ribosomal protein small subunit ribosomal protein [Candidatus Taylorbacteria bacterium]|nr:ribosomal protein small subunit ribosomal protein [Candidatus Taylorbacteria bacterium]